MTTPELIARTVAVKELEAAVQSAVTTRGEADQDAVTGIYRQVVALRRAMESLIVARAIQAQEV